LIYEVITESIVPFSFYNAFCLLCFVHSYIVLLLRKSETISPMMMAIRIMLGRLKPVIARIPSTARIQRMRRAPAISLNGLGKRLMAIATIARIRRSTMLTICPLMTKSDVSGMFIPSTRR
jgi:hypothetical protein